VFVLKYQVMMALLYIKGAVDGIQR